MKHNFGVMSDFSIGKSLLQIPHIIETAKTGGYESVALADEMTVSSMVDFANRAKKAGVRPVIGVKLRVYQDPTYRKPPKASGVKEKENPFFIIKAYSIGDKGIPSILKLLSKANSEECFYYHSRTGLDDVLALENVVITTGDFFNVFHRPDHLDILAKLKEKFDVYAELVPINTPLFDRLNKSAMEAAGLLGLPTLVSYPALYREDSEAASLDVLSCITSNTAIDTPWRPRQFVKDFSLATDCRQIGTRIKGAIERAARFDGVKASESLTFWSAGLRNQQPLAERLAYEFKKQDVSLPKMAENEFMTLGQKCLEGWIRRFTHPVLGYKPSPEQIPAYKARLSYELGVLKKMGFAGYFLLVEDLVMWAKKNSIIVGPGRGSVGGSLVAYLIGITDVDPIRFNLLFERFINPERLDLPDADLDFQSSQRHRVVGFLADKYGADRVAGISNYSTMASASALRDTGRVYGLNGLELAATKLVPKEHGQSFTLTQAADTVPELDQFRTDRAEIWRHALSVEGAMRSLGQHAAGVVVAGEPLVNRAVVETRSGSPVVNWDKRVVEDMGLVKMDILGLSTLDVLEIARGYIKDRHGVEVDYLALPLGEERVMDAFGRGDTTGVFQFESPGMKKLLRSLAKGGPLTFDDVTAATALYRPGPMDSGLMADFVAIKKGDRDPSYEHPLMEAALKDTYGVIIYQEQVMQLAVDLAGFTRAEADHLRKAMGKKDKDKMADMRSKWVDGCGRVAGMGELAAGELFDKIEAFAGYGFNKSHAVEYSIISYWTMWVRIHYPAEYFAACMSIVAEDKLPGLVADARSCGIEVLPPDVNKSSARFTIPDDKHILAPFCAVKGISETTANRIAELRAKNRDWKVVKVKRKRDGTTEEVWGRDLDAPMKGRFDSFDEFQRMSAEPGSKVSSLVVERLRLVGAMATVEPGAKPATHPDRRKDQMQLMPGLIIDAVKASRETDASEKFLRAKLIMAIKDYKACEGCDLADQAHPTARCGSTIKFMVVTDCPSWQEERADKMLTGDAAEYMKEAIKEAGLEVRHGYFTSLVKAKKSDKFLSNAQINGCRRHIDCEMELIKPAVIVALGSATIKHFVPGIKGGTAELAGKTIYDPTLDATIVCGINPQQLAFDPGKAEILEAVFEKVAEILS